MTLIYGQAQATIDSKHRLPISMEFRLQIDRDDGDGFIVTLGPDYYLWIYPDTYFTRLLASLDRLPLPEEESEDLSMFYAFAEKVKPDSQGRIVLSERSRAQAILADQVVLVGNNDHIEVWPTAAWAQRVKDKMPNYRSNLLTLSRRLRAERRGLQSVSNSAQGRAVPAREQTPPAAMEGDIKGPKKE